MDKILLVEDNQSLIDIYTITFNHEHFNLDVATNGEECLQRVKSSKPDIILLDVMMPKLNGIETLEKLKADSTTKDIPVIMLSNIAEPNEEAKTRDLGAAGYLIKSHYLPMDIVKFVKDILLKTRLQK